LGAAAIQLSTASAISLKLTRSMSGIARRIADTLEPETKPVRKPASSMSRAPLPSPQPGITCSRGSSSSAFSAAACGRILVSLDTLNTVSRARLPDRRDARNRNA